MSDAAIVLSSRADWAREINHLWSEQVESFFATGRALLRSKEALPHGEFEAMVDGELSFGPRTARQLMAIASHPVLSNRIHGSDLPPSWRTLYYLSRLPEPRLLAAIKAGEITPETERKDAMRLLDAHHREQKATEGKEETCTVEDLHLLVRRGSRFRTVYADPPWPYGNQATRSATDRHYETMTLKEIAALPVPALSEENAHLHLWTTNAFVREALALMAAWGFEYKSCFVWTKPTMGIGNYWRVSHEFLLFGLRGELPFGSRSLISWGTFKRGKHSAKPQKIRELVEKASPSPRLELFGRQPADGWTVWGNEITRTMFDGDVRALTEEDGDE